MSEQPDSQSPALRRAVGGVAITIYAVGDILGAGIYALVGDVAGKAGSGAWVSMLVAATIALITGLSYAELSSRYPVASGAAGYCRRAFGPPSIGFVIGILVLTSGVTSAATVSRAFVGYLAPFIEIQPAAASVGLLALMSALSWWGIEESSQANIVLTAVELSGLLLVIGAGLVFASDLPLEAATARLAPAGDLPVILGGATVAFFAYVGFEDTVNIAEEVRDPARALPRAILTAIAFTTVVYLAVVAAALLTVGPDALARSEGPLLTVLDAAGVRLPANAFSIVALLAVANTGLLNLIMASRLLYGMSRDGLLPPALGRVDRVRQTPAVAVATAFVLAAGLGLTGGATILAQSTSLLLLTVFAAVHLALLTIKRREGRHGGYNAPGFAPVLGLLGTIGLGSQFPAGAFARAAIALGAALCLYLAFGRRDARHRVPGSRP